MSVDDGFIEWNHHSKGRAKPSYEWGEYHPEDTTHNTMIEHPQKRVVLDSDLKLDRFSNTYRKLPKQVR